MVVAGREVGIIGGVDVGLDSSAVGVDATVHCRMPGPGGALTLVVAGAIARQRRPAMAKALSLGSISVLPSGTRGKGKLAQFVRE